MLDGIFSTEIWLTTTTIIGLIYALFLMTYSSNKLLRGSSSNIFTLFIILFVIIYIGTRPIWCYSDTGLYTTIFNLVKNGIWDTVYGSSNESFWLFIEYQCINLTTASNWLLIIASFYIVGMCWAAYRWMPKHLFIAVIFLFTAFSFWGYATNGIRHGMATSLAMLGLSFLTGKKNLFIGYSFLLLSILTHNSCALIAIMATISIFFKNTRRSINIWFLCIILGLLFQSQFKALFAETISDDRFTNYVVNMDVSVDVFSETGFRWDFILYSSMPILLGWYTLIKKGITDATYTFLLNTYIYTNSFWILINTTAFSNRFAYLSWFLYPILLAYPLVKFRIFTRQGISAGLILAASVLFTFIML